MDQLEKAGIRGSSGITVDSVERFQGSERKVIIITGTRTDGLGFLGCDLVSIYNFYF
jgi:superfamily I DNA and/or RNA helicase